MGTIIALLVFSFLIFFHELGHFLAARFFGVHVEVFSIGFGKRILTKKFGATEWSFSMIPLGGYVRMKGQDDSDPSKNLMTMIPIMLKHHFKELSSPWLVLLPTFYWLFYST